MPKAKLSSDEAKKRADRAERSSKQRQPVVATGRPTDYSDIIADQICELLADGQSLRRICLDETMPARSTVFRWLSLNPQFSDQYARAREAQAEVMADEIVGIADGVTLDETASMDVQRDRLRVDARKWVASKLLPKKYGDKTISEVSGPDGGPIPVNVVERRIVKPNTVD